MGNGELLPPVFHSWWVLALGVGLVLLVGIWVGAWVVRARMAPKLRAELGMREPTLAEVDSEMRSRYFAQLLEIKTRYEAGKIDARDLHLSVAAVIRALGTERSGIDLEVLSVAEVARRFPSWPQIAVALRQCETPSFAGGGDQEIARTLDLARAVVGQ